MTRAEVAQFHDVRPDRITHLEEPAAGSRPVATQPEQAAIDIQSLHPKIGQSTLE
jgi:hypothetical protein